VPSWKAESKAHPAANVGQQVALESALRPASIEIDLDCGRRSADESSDDSSGFCALRGGQGRRRASINLDTDDRYHDRTRRHRQGLEPGANEDAIASKAERARQICDRGLAGTDESEIFTNSLA
jgi:hypothetical protein